VNRSDRLWRSEEVTGVFKAFEIVFVSWDRMIDDITRKEV